MHRREGKWLNPAGAVAANQYLTPARDAATPEWQLYRRRHLTGTEERSCAGPGTTERRLEHLRLQGVTQQVATCELEQDTAIKRILMQCCHFVKLAVPS